MCIREPLRYRDTVRAREQAGVNCTGASAPPPSAILSQGAAPFGGCQLVGGGFLAGSSPPPREGPPPGGLGTALPPTQCGGAANSLPAGAVARHYLEAVRRVKSSAQLEELWGDAILRTLLARAKSERVQVTHKNGRVSTNSCAGMRLKETVRKSQRNKTAAAERAKAERVAQRSRVAATPLSPAEHVGLLAAVGLSDAKHNRIHRARGGRSIGMARLDVLRAVRTTFANIPSAGMSIDDTGAHLQNLRGAVEERLCAVWDAQLFLERPVRTSEGVVAAQTRDYKIPHNGDPGCSDGSPGADERDVQLSLGLDKGGSPRSVNEVLGILNQAQLNNIGNTLLAATCPCVKDEYPHVAAMITTHVAQGSGLLHHGVLNGGHRRAVRLILAGDCDSLCTMSGTRGRAPQCSASGASGRGPQAGRSTPWCR